MIFPPLFNDLAHLFSFIIGPVIVLAGSGFLVGSILYSFTAVTIFMIRNQE